MFNLAVVNRAKDATEFMEGIFLVALTLLNTLRKHNNTCPVMLSSSTGRFGNYELGRSKKAGGILVPDYLDENVSSKVVRIIQRYVSGKGSK